MPPKPVGSILIDGCMPSAGYVWCEILNECVRTWMTACAYPKNCLTWNDGCNTCQLEGGELSICTEMMCFERGVPQCLVWTPGTISTMPVIDYAPYPITNPFLSDGH
tara:strand:+ start:2614 stop:2934 length:321 start_codon:yes stop_codon:yes gene_type:complete